MEKISYIHFTDLHIGQKGANPIFSTTKEILKEDIAYICDQLGSLDIVLMTGDMVQKGTSDEFQLFTDFLEEMWGIFRAKNFDPYFLCVPGNHDLERSGNTSAAVHQMMAKWMANPQLRSDLFWEKDSEYIQYVKERFQTYSDWYEGLSVKKPEMTKGILPGDFYSSIKIGETNIGIVGLNSAFLQIESGDYQGKLGIYNRQIAELFNNNFAQEIRKNRLSFLLTHHAPDWYEAEARNEYENEINGHGYFQEHFCGHMHTPSTLSYSSNFASAKRITTGASLFGLEEIEGKKIERIHGYNAGFYTIEEDKITKTIYPRTSQKKSNGIDIDKDPSFLYPKGKEYVEFVLSQTPYEANRQISGMDNYPNVLEKNAYSTTPQFIPSLIKHSGPHLYIRDLELRQAALELQTKRLVWINAQFGLGEDGFIAALLETEKIDKNNCFIVNCEDVSTIKDLEKQITEQFSVPLNQFVDFLDKNGSKFVIILKNISSGFVENELAVLKQTINSIQDFSKSISFIFCSSTKPEQNYFVLIELKALSLEDTKRYIDHVKPDNNFTRFDVQTIYDLSSGFPVCLDNILQQLEYVEISDLSNADYEIEEGGNILPEATKQHIVRLRGSSNKEEKRCYTLLLLLSLLPKGEAFDVIKRFIGNQPFSPNDVQQLSNKNFLNVEYYYVIKRDGSIESIRTLKIPRIYRDFVFSLENRDSLLTYYKDICALYLGNDWFQYKIKLQSARKSDACSFVYHNTEVALKALIDYNIKIKKTEEIARLLRIVYNFIHQLQNLGLFNVAYYISNDVFSIVNSDLGSQSTELFPLLKYQLAELARMNGLREKAATLLKELLEEKKLPKKEMQTCRLRLAYAYDMMKDKEEALLYAKELAMNEKNKKSYKKIAADYIQAIWEEDKRTRINKLKRIYAAARLANSKTLSSNIAIEIAYSEPVNSSLKRLEEESKTCTDLYTKMRIVVAKSKIIYQSSADKIPEMAAFDLYTVYSYAFNQMLADVLSGAHDLLWRYNLEKKDYKQLLFLFKHSSFVWRMCDKPEREKECIGQIKNNLEFVDWVKQNPAIPEVTFLLQRGFQIL